MQFYDWIGLIIDNRGIEEKKIKYASISTIFDTLPFPVFVQKRRELVRRVNIFPFLETICNALTIPKALSFTLKVQVGANQSINQELEGLQPTCPPTQHAGGFHLHRGPIAQHLVSCRSSDSVIK
jgi:hypothetical protein